MNFPTNLIPWLTLLALAASITHTANLHSEINTLQYETIIKLLRSSTP